MPTDTPAIPPAVAAVAYAFAGWADAVHSTRAEIRAEAIAEGGDPDGPVGDARLREVVAAARDELPGLGWDAFDWVVGGMREHLDATETQP